MNLREYFAQQVTRRPEATALRAEGVEWTYADVDRQARRVAA
jgi:non-ribosomal peptide synthetase component F